MVGWVGGEWVGWGGVVGLLGVVLLVGVGDGMGGWGVVGGVGFGFLFLGGGGVDGGVVVVVVVVWWVVVWWWSCGWWCSEFSICVIVRGTAGVNLCPYTALLRSAASLRLCS